MKVKIIKTRYDEAYLIPMGDLHVGDLAFDEESLDKARGYIEWVKKRPNAYIMLMGDLINCATKDSKSSAFSQNMTMEEQLDFVVKLFKPVKEKIIGAITGNHEERLENYCGYNPTITICDRLNTYYLGYDGILIFRLGCYGKRSNPRGTFSVYCHHTTGGGCTVGGKINRSEMLRRIVCNCDAYLGSHNHLLGCIHTQIYRVNESYESVESLRQMIVDCGGYINYEDSYANAKQMPPLKIGSPKLRFIIKRFRKRRERIDEVHKDIHVSI